MQLITKNELIELANIELKKLPDYDETIVIVDVKQEGNAFIFWADLDTTEKMILANELIEKIDPIFRDKYLISR